MEGGSDQAEPAGLTCQRHARPTRITCATCDTPICPTCAVRTQVGLKCPEHAPVAAAPRKNRFQAVGGLLLLVAIAGFIHLARTTGRGEPAKPPCPTETAPDVGIGSEGGPHWTEMSRSGLCGRYRAAHVWTGTQLLIWGGENCAGAACPTFRAPHLADGAAYTPAADAWRKLPSSPLSARAPAVTAWTGKEMIAWGGVAAEGVLADGAAYDPARDRWRPLAPGPLSARDGVSSAWTGRELVIWGGGDLDKGLPDGAAYDPATDRWRTIALAPLSPRAGGAAAWTGREMVVWGGIDPPAAVEFRDGAAYDPATDRWRPIAESPLSGRNDAAAAWTGRELLVWGGNTVRGDTFLADGASYDPATDRWRLMANAPLVARSAPAAVWSGRELLIWGGISLPGVTDSGPLDRILERRTLLAPIDDGAAYDPATDRWRTLEPVPLLGRASPIAVWDGKNMLMWGGLVVVSSPASSSEGVRYTP
ncbi:MAG: Kelch repeat-containing protein [Acidimicrobiales bacterium]